MARYVYLFLLCMLAIPRVAIAAPPIAAAPGEVPRPNFTPVNPSSVRLPKPLPTGPAPNITSILPTDPDGFPIATAGKTTLRILGSHFTDSPIIAVVVTPMSEISAEQTSGPSTEIVEWQPQSVAANEVTVSVSADFPGDSRHYLVWIASNNGWSNPFEVLILHPTPMTISSIDNQYPGLETIIHGSGFKDSVGAYLVASSGPILPQNAMQVRFIDSTQVAITLPRANRLGALDDSGSWKKRVYLTALDAGPAEGQVTILYPVIFNLYWSWTDANGIPWNPMWGAQLLYPPSDSRYYPSLKNCIADAVSSRGVTKCTTQPVSKMGSAWCSFGINFGMSHGYGHFNWMAGTYTGSVSYDSYDSWDKDYNFYLATPEGAGSTEAATGDVKLESTRGETFNYFDTEWWAGLEDRVLGPLSGAQAYLRNRPAIVTGLIGLDCAHDCDTELHPIYAMAINTSSTSNEDRWSIFVRNWGSEGFCSDDENHLPIFLPGNRYILKLPWRPDGLSAEIDLEHTVFKYRTGAPVSVNYWVAPGDGIYVVFNLTDPSRYPLAWGELHVKWPSGAPPYQPYQFWGANTSPSGKHPVELTGEKLFEEELGKLPPERRAALLSELDASQREAELPLRKGVPIVVKQISPLGPKLLHHTTVPRFANTTKPKASAHTRRKLDSLEKAGLLTAEQKAELLREAENPKFRWPILETVPPPATK